MTFFYRKVNETVNKRKFDSGSLTRHTEFTEGFGKTIVFRLSRRELRFTVGPKEDRGVLSDGGRPYVDLNRSSSV